MSRRPILPFLPFLAVLAAACGGEATAPGSSRPVASVTMALAVDTVLIGESIAVTVRTLDDSGAVLADRPVAWSSSDSTVLSVSPGGVIVARHPGSATLRASSGDASASHTLHVRALRFAALSTSRTITCGREETGELWCWGAIPANGFGNGSTKPAQSPVPRRAAVGHRFASLALSGGKACGVELDHTVSCWDAFAQPVPATLAGLSNVTAVAVGTLHSCAVASGAVWCWGANFFGQLGDGTRTESATPVRVAAIPAASAVTVGFSHSCALTTQGAFCWGGDFSGELGHDTTYQRLVPTRAGAIPGMTPAYTDVSAEGAHTCALSAGVPYCWGSFDTSDSGDGWEVVAALPSAQAAGHQLTRLSVGFRFNCGLQADGTAWCWIFGLPAGQYPSAVPITDVVGGYAFSCALDGNGVITCGNPPAAVPNAPPFIRLAAGADFGCGLTAAGAVWCWPTFVAAPAELLSGSTVFSSIWSGAHGSVCGLSGPGDVWCDHGGMIAEAVGYSIVQVAHGGDFTCGLTAGGTALCWGANYAGQLGDGTLVAHAAPMPVSGGLAFTSLSAGYAHVCGTTADGSLYCWGEDRDGQFGDGGAAGVPPQLVTGGRTFTALATQVYRSCALATDGSVACWPARTTIPAPTPQTQIALGEQLGCSLDAGGLATCWAPPTGSAGWRVSTAPAELRFASIAVGGGTACGLTLSGAAWCWGANGYDTLGSPDAKGLTGSDLPVKVYGQE